MSWITRGISIDTRGGSSGSMLGESKYRIYRYFPFWLHLNPADVIIRNVPPEYTTCDGTLSRSYRRRASGTEPSSRKQERIRRSVTNFLPLDLISCKPIDYHLSPLQENDHVSSKRNCKKACLQSWKVSLRSLLPCFREVRGRCSGYDRYVCASSL